jgi:oxygen-independent coproporphyrinogen-3 oxidase
MLGLYVHVPFCAAICNYCNFNRGLFDAAVKTRYVDALLSEITMAERLRPCRAEEPFLVRGEASAKAGAGGGAPAPVEKNPCHADTVYFGGGTPSLLEPEEVARIIEACEGAFEISADREVTLEANPESVTVERLAAYRRAGVNRLSFGVQSFRDDELARLSRLHGADRARAAVAEARAAGFDNVSLDLMMWLPGQSVEHWLYSLDEAVALAPDHLSLYLLELYPNAPLKDEMARARCSQAPDEEAAAMYVAGLERLDRAGYEQYEISNVSRPGRRSRHNLKYWSDGEWIGFGCGAHSTRCGSRWKNVSAVDEYVRRVAGGEPLAAEVHALSPAQRLGDALFTGLRLNDGIDEAAIEHRYGVDVWARYGGELQTYIDGGLLHRQEGRMWLTRQGMLLANEVMAVFI